MSAISRRSMIAGFATGVAAGVTPAVVASPVEIEDPASRVDRLSQELSEALSHWCGGSFRAVVEPSIRSGNQVWLQSMRAPRPGAAS